MDVFIAHKNEQGEKQSLIDHLVGTADFTASFADVFRMKQTGYTLGMLHDLGKYSDAFQNRILYGKEKVDHSSAGAQVAIKRYGALIGTLLAYAIAGHHAGLMDYGNEEDGLQKRLKNKNLCNYQAYQHEVRLLDHLEWEKEIQEILNKWQGHEKMHTYVGFQLSMQVRMLFSCLVDGDFLDTERFMNPQQFLARSDKTIEGLFDKLEAHINPYLEAESPSFINQKRTNILRHCLQSAILPKGLFSLTVPTGGGKTVSSMAFALRHAQVHGLRRIIYVIPYVSIIEQTANVFADIFGREFVLEHHANFEFDNIHEDETVSELTLKLATENWDMPIIVTTNVQFFESLFANRTSRSRKLHNIAESVIVLDEAQMLPLYFLKPSLMALEELQRSFGCSVVFCTATKPEFPEGFFIEPVKELIDNVPELYSQFKRTEITYIGEYVDDDLIIELEKYDQCLCIVNRRRHAAKLYQKLSCRHKYHLSAQMCPAHRSMLLLEIKSRLKKGLPCIVISTQLVECGVDISFPVVYRCLAGLDSIIQSAGRCNRNQELSMGSVRVFRSLESYAKLNSYQSIAADTGKEILEKYEDVSALEANREYFSKLYAKLGNKLDKENIVNDFTLDSSLQLSFPFESAAKKFRLIEENFSLVIPCNEDVKAWMKDFHFVPSIKLMRNMARYTISVYDNQIKELRERGAIEQVGDHLFFLRELNSFYNNHLGLMIDEPEFLCY